VSAVDLSKKRLRLLREALWDTERERRGIYLQAIAEVIEAAIVEGRKRDGVAALLRRAGYGRSELALLREWAIKANNWDLDDVLAAISAEIFA
jgi:hypothetical protein